MKTSLSRKFLYSTMIISAILGINPGCKPSPDNAPNTTSDTQSSLESTLSPHEKVSSSLGEPFLTNQVYENPLLDRCYIRGTAKTSQIRLHSAENTDTYLFFDGNPHPDFEHPYISFGTKESSTQLVTGAPKNTQSPLIELLENNKYGNVKIKADGSVAFQVTGGHITLEKGAKKDWFFSTIAANGENYFIKTGSSFFYYNKNKTLDINSRNILDKKPVPEGTILLYLNDEKNNPLIPGVDFTIMKNSNISVNTEGVCTPMAGLDLFLEITTPATDKYPELAFFQEKNEKPLFLGIPRQVLWPRIKTNETPDTSQDINLDNIQDPESQVIELDDSPSDLNQVPKDE